nr:YjdF family protein [Lactococcus hircilactis]
MTVLFKKPFWVGIFERRYDDKIEVAKVIFGKEPKDYEVYDFVLTQYYNLKFSPAIKTEVINDRKINPKRLQKLAKKQASEVGIGTKAQQALKVQQEERKLERTKSSRAQREAKKQKQFELRQKKRYEKHRGH